MGMFEWTDFLFLYGHSRLLTLMTGMSVIAIPDTGDEFKKLVGTFKHIHVSSQFIISTFNTVSWRRNVYSMLVSLFLHL